MTTTEQADTPPSASRGMHPLRLAYWLGAGMLWGLVLWWSFFAPSPDTIERVYSRGLFRLFNGTLPGLTEGFGFSIALVIVSTIVLGFPLLWAARWVWLRKVRGKSHWAGLAFGLRILFVLAPLIICWFVLIWGAGYGRLPAEARLSLPTDEISDTESAELRAAMLRIIETDLILEEQRDIDRAVASIAAAMKGVVEQWDGVPVRLPKGVKATPPGLLLANGTSGIASPLTLEPHVDGGLPSTAFVYVAAHELGHVAGMNVEAEATLAGFAAGLKADDPYARWCVALDVYLDLVRQLPREEAKAAMELLPELAKKDIQASREAGEKYRIKWLDTWSWRLYDGYLKAQGIAEGRKNYGKGISLFVYAWRKGLITLPESAKPNPQPQEASAPPAQTEESGGDDSI